MLSVGDILLAHLSDIFIYPILSYLSHFVMDLSVHPSVHPSLCKLFTFLAHLSELMTQVSFSDKNLPIAVVIIGFVVKKISHFHLLLQNHWVKFNQTFYTKHPWGKGFKIVYLNIKIQHPHNFQKYQTKHFLHIIASSFPSNIELSKQKTKHHQSKTFRYIKKLHREHCFVFFVNKRNKWGFFVFLIN